MIKANCFEQKLSACFENNRKTLNYCFEQITRLFSKHCLTNVVLFQRKCLFFSKQVLSFLSKHMCCSKQVFVFKTSVVTNLGSPAGLARVGVLLAQNRARAIARISSYISIHFYISLCVFAYLLFVFVYIYIYIDFFI